MRQAIVQTLHTVRRASTRGLINGRLEGSLPAHLLTRAVSSKTGTPSTTRAGSRRLRRTSYGILGTAGLTGAWYLYSGAPTSSEAGILAAQSAKSFSSSTDSQFPKRALVIDDEQLYFSSDISQDHIAKIVDGRQMVIETLSPEQATELLRKNEESYLIGRGNGVVRYDVVQVASNNPIEDDHSETILPHQSVGSSNETSDWMFWGVYDGHSGWSTSAKLRQVLINFVARELNDTFKASIQNKALALPSAEAIDLAIKKGFLRLDHEITNTNVERLMKQSSKAVAAELLAPALSGSCALLSFYDSRTQLLRVACTGDSRAVLGRRSTNGKWTATALSEDQTGGTPSEEARLRKEHPGEEFVVRNGRIFGGLEPSRAFGDAHYKWPLAVLKRLKESFFVRSASSLYRTPPYVTAEPVVTTTKIEPANGDFLVMATDGLWEMLTNEEVVGLVGKWLETEKQKSGSSQKSWFGGWLNSRESLPIQKADDATGETSVPIRQEQWKLKDALEKRFVVEDKNAATHLVRNALGGKDEDAVCSLLTLPSPFSRRYRDDLTVEVIFFGDGNETGKVTLNLEASASKQPVKAKL